MSTAEHSSIEPRPLAAIDSLLEELTRAKNEPAQGDYETPLADFANAILAHVGYPRGNWAPRVLDTLFDADLTSAHRLFIATCLLRLLAADERVFQEVTFRNRACKLLDETLEHRLYSRLKIKARQQTHEKLRVLKDVVPEAEELLASGLRTLSDLKSVELFDRSLLSSLNKTSVEIIVKPFLPKASNPASLHAFCQSVTDYLRAEPSQLVSYIERVRTAGRHITQEAMNCGTRYSSEYLMNPVNQILEMVNTHFCNSPVRLEANLNIPRPDKKFPLHIVNEPICLTIEIDNEGPGYAFDVGLTVIEIPGAKVESREIAVGDLPPSRRTVTANILLSEPKTDLVAEFLLEWSGFDQKRSRTQIIQEFVAQKADVDWSRLARVEPYDLEPVTTESELVGRSEILNQLTGMVTATSIGSAIVYGQKRVGKTSIVKTLATRLSNSNPDIHCIYVLAGEYVRPDPLRTIEALGRRLCCEVAYLDERFAKLPTPVFDDALAPLNEYVNAAFRVKSTLKILIILDEFDELPSDLYSRNEIANSFFLSIRSLSANPNIGFILVGSERMNAIMQYQGQELNKFKPIRVDYFDRRAQWPDFVNLVRTPTINAIEFSDEAVGGIYGYTAGNPYFTKLLCKSIYKLMVGRRDSHVTGTEVTEAAKDEVSAVDVNSFQHFWEDGIVERNQAEREKVSVLRRQVLLALADVIRRTDRRVSFDQIRLAAQQFELSDEVLKAELDEFVERQVLDSVSQLYGVKVRFFSEWLKESGVNQILSRLGERVATIARRVAEQAYVRSEEIVCLTQKWGNFKGQQVSQELVRTWLKQFESNVDQRLMFRVLEAARFYSEGDIRERCASTILRHS